MTKRVLVTGGAGFIGSHVADLFLSEGYEVEIIDNFASGKRENLPAGAKFHEASVTSPEAADVVRNGNFDVVVHLAAQIDVRKSVADPLFDATTNILGTVNLLEAVKTTGRKTRVAFTSTGGAIYGDFNKPPNVETFPKDPESPYAISKLASEYYLSYYGRIHGVEHVAMRFGNVYGPRQDPHGEAGVVAIFCTRILENKPLTVSATDFRLAITSTWVMSLVLFIWERQATFRRQLVWMPGPSMSEQESELRSSISQSSCSRLPAATRRFRLPQSVRASSRKASSTRARRERSLAGSRR
jgi:nucleoside-diphosphate-sugar epimerase